VNVRYIGIMQGRLLPPEAGHFQCFPRERWKEEFELASRCGLDSIEWIYDVWGQDVNPLFLEHGEEQVRALAQRHNVAVVSLCADYFMDKPLIRVTDHDRRDRTEHLSWLIGRCQQFGIARMVLPFVDNSAIRSQQEMQEVISVLDEALPLAAKYELEIHLETSLPPREFAELLERLPFSNLKVNYDSGNSASLGYGVHEELAAYGERIGSVHIKDRIRGGGTVPLGTGNADIRGLLAGLHRLGYSGDLILQVARGESGHEVDWVRSVREIVNGYLEAIRERVHESAS